MTLEESRRVATIATAAAVTTTAGVGALDGLVAAAVAGVVTLGAALATVRLLVTRPRG